MRAVVQRVSSASVNVDGVSVASIGQGLMVLVGLGAGDDDEEIDYMARKIAALRIFEDAEGKMNMSVSEAGGSLLLVSQFTLYGNTRKGCRPSFTGAMPVDQARAFWPRVERRFLETGIKCALGVFQGNMQCALVNDGPVTIIIDSAERG